MNELAGKPLRYKIGTDNPGPGRIGEILEVAYDIETPSPVGNSVGYCNLFDESSTGAFPPYRPITDTAKQYDELVPDATGPGFEANLRAQFTRRRDGGFRYVELDNPDAYALKDVIRATDLAQSYGLGVIAKNPLAMDEDATAWLRHPNVYGVIVEKDAGTPDQMQVMRTAAGKPELPVWLVFFGDGLSAARACAIRAGKFSNMSVTFDRAADEYGGEVEDFQLPQTQEPFMAEPAHLTLARSLIGKYTDGPDVPMLAMEIAASFPEMTSYCRIANSGTSWCGIFIAIVLLRSYRTRPPFGTADVRQFMWVDAWEDEQWGAESIPVSQAQPGDIVILRKPHHITFLDKVDGDTFYCIGGNQWRSETGKSDAVTRGAFSRDGVRAIRRPPLAGVIAQPNSLPLRPAVSNFDRCLPLLLEHEGGYSNHPSDPGGPTNFGITIFDYRMYIDPNGSAANVRAMTVDQAKVIYRQKYWDAMSCDDLPSGVDYAIFDYGVNSGIGRAPKVLQRIVVPQEVDGEIGPNTIAATAAADPRILIGQICDERLAFLQGLGTWSTFGDGWGRRVREVRAAALEMAATPKPTGNPMPKATEPQFFPPGTQIPGQQVDWAELINMFIQRALPVIVAAVQQAQTGKPITLPPLLPSPVVVEPPPPPPPVVAPPATSTASTVAKNAAGGLLGVLAAFATWYNGGISDVTAINTGLGAIAGTALSAYSPLINLGLGLLSRISFKAKPS